MTSKSPRTSASSTARTNPPPPFPIALTPEDAAHAPSPSLFTSTSLTPPALTPPTPAQLTAHLLLLSVFHAHRQRIINDPAIQTLFSSTDPDALYRAYVEAAVPRFTAWWHNLSKSAAWTPAHLPPLDVLVIWHSWLLNPRIYYDDIHRLGVDERMLEMRFPWADIIAAIDVQTLAYTLGAEASTQFLALGVGPVCMESDMPGRESIHIPCPACDASLTVLISAWHAEDFSTTCPCGTTTTRLSLRQHKLTHTHGPHMHGAASPPTPSLLPSTPLSTLLPLLTPPPTTPLAALLHKFYPPVSAPPYAPTNLCLSSAVHRQSTFVVKMHNLGFLRSPFLAGTLRRAVRKYERFFVLFKALAGRTLVPTLDVDLVWHTQQLWPGGYEKWCRERAGRSIEHDDQFGKDDLGVGFALTQTEYKRRWWWAGWLGEAYGGCLCWRCEGKRDGDRGVDVKVAFWNVVERRRVREMEGGMVEGEGAGKKEDAAGEDGVGISLQGLEEALEEERVSCWLW